MSTVLEKAKLQIGRFFNRKVLDVFLFFHKTYVVGTHLRRSNKYQNI